MPSSRASTARVSDARRSGSCACRRRSPRRCRGCSQARWTSCRWAIRRGCTDVGPVIDADALRTPGRSRDESRTERRGTAAGSGPIPATDTFSRRSRSRSTPSADSSARSSARSSMCCVTDPTGSRRSSTPSTPRLWTHLRYPHADRQHRAQGRCARERGQRVREPQHDRRGGGRSLGGGSGSRDGTQGRRPHYLHRFAHERTLTINTSAVGGNASLLAME